MSACGLHRTGAGAGAEFRAGERIGIGRRGRTRSEGLDGRTLAIGQSHARRAVAAVDRRLRVAILDPFPQLAGIPRAARIARLALGHVEVDIGECRIARQLARREVRLHRVQRLLE